MPLGFVGDIHGSIAHLSDVVKETVPYPNVVAVIQVGDMLLSYDEVLKWKKHKWKFAKPTYWIDGNHEYFHWFHHLTEVTEVIENLFYVPRGTVLTLDNRKIGFMGGAESIDKKDGMMWGTWHPEENISVEDWLRFEKNIREAGGIDLLVSHVPPQSIIEKYFDSNGRGKEVRRHFGMPDDWKDRNAVAMDYFWKSRNKVQMVCGHMHRHQKFDNDSHVLGEFQFITL